jgi:hypothetical protein
MDADGTAGGRVVEGIAAAVAVELAAERAARLDLKRVRGVAAGESFDAA